MPAGSASTTVSPSPTTTVAGPIPSSTRPWPSPARAYGRTRASGRIAARPPAPAARPTSAASLGALGSDDDAALVGLAAGAGGRAAILPLALVLPYARAGEGQGRVLDGIGPATVVVGLGLAVVLALPAGTGGLAGLGSAAVVTAALGLYWRRWLGGVTGDLLGATAKLAETAILVTALAVL